MAQEISSGTLITSRTEQEAVLKLLLGEPVNLLETKLLDELKEHLQYKLRPEVKWYGRLHS